MEEDWGPLHTLLVPGPSDPWVATWALGRAPRSLDKLPFCRPVAWWHVWIGVAVYVHLPVVFAGCAVTPATYQWPREIQDSRLEFKDAEKRRNVPATRNPLCLWLFGGEPFKVLYCVHIATNSEHWLDAFHLRNKPQGWRHLLNHFVHRRILQTASSVVEVDALRVELF